MGKLVMPKERKYGWELKPTSSVHWGQVKNKSGQLCVVLEHSLLRGVTSEMIVWWFKNFANLRVTLDDIEGYENIKVPAYLLWHPSDHINASFKGKLGENNTARAGGKIQIKEAMQFNKYGLKYPVENELNIFYCEKDGWGMGKQIPFLGTMIFLRISFKDVYENGEIIGVHYHYEVVAGTHKQNFIAKAITKKIVGQYTSEFWEAWITHNTIEVGVFENFLPALYSQRHDLSNLHYAKSMNPITKEMSAEIQTGFDFKLLEDRLKGYEESENAFSYQKGLEKSFL
ncbi:hypothetical protein [Sediminitomix flava]|uniref:DAPG hydrolase PhiG domain-containing protein n=1 Tax=Sediminitomix flava TaxID=379075 RepID=A0A316A5B0_SEDFL|nr:hypothetical protein [Sediminitomix flava]PWJ44947.1 hypothetical protein BC781_1011340 [Sediminitomix flava]